MADKNVEDAKAFGIIGYIIPLVGVIWYLVDEKMKKNKFAQFHAKQMLVFLIAILIMSAISWIPLIGLVQWILYLVWMIMGIVAVANGQKKELWLIGQFGEKFNI